MDEILGWAALVSSIIALGISISSWHKSRAVYEVIIKDDRPGNFEELNKLLASGEYTLLQVKQDTSNVLRTIYVLGRIKNGRSK